MINGIIYKDDPIAILECSIEDRLYNSNVFHFKNNKLQTGVKKLQLFVVGTFTEDFNIKSIVGVYTSEDLAVAAAEDGNFVGPITANETAPREGVPCPGAYLVEKPKTIMEE